MSTGVRRPASLRGRVVLTVLALLVVLLSALFSIGDALLTARLHSDLRTRLTDRAALARQLDGALSPQQLVNRLRGDGVSILLCRASSTSGSSSSSSGGLQCVTADSGPPAPPDGRPTGQAVGAQPDASQPTGTRPTGTGPTGGRPTARPPRQPAVPSSTSVQQAGPVLFLQTTLPSTRQTLTLSVDSSTVGATLHRLIVLELIGGLIALAVAAAMLGWLVGRALRPLDDMTTVARRIGAGDRGRRLRTGRPDTELGRTAAAFDDMLDELESALAVAAAAETRLRDFLSDVSHELRTPLTGLAATTETLLRDEPERAERERAYVTLVRETRRAGRLVDDLLTVTRLDTGMALQAEPVDLGEIAAQEVERLRLLAPGLDVRLAAPGPARVDGDPLRLGQIVANLLQNARTAAGPDGAVRVDVRTGTGTGTVVLEVCDSGPGVPAEHRDRIFERLVRLDDSRARTSGGFGLGLAIARMLARAHAGELICTAPPTGRGACFRLTLPSLKPGPSPEPLSPTRQAVTAASSSPRS